MDDVRRPTWLIRIASPPLFYAPVRQMAQLWELNKRNVAVDRQWWRDYVAARERPWSDYVLYVSRVDLPSV